MPPTACSQVVVGDTRLYPLSTEAPRAGQVLAQPSNATALNPCLPRALRPAQQAFLAGIELALPPGAFEELVCQDGEVIPH